MNVKARKTVDSDRICGFFAESISSEIAFTIFEMPFLAEYDKISQIPSKNYPSTTACISEFVVVACLFYKIVSKYDDKRKSL